MPVSALGDDDGVAVRVWGESVGLTVGHSVLVGPFVIVPLNEQGGGVDDFNDGVWNPVAVEVFGYAGAYLWELNNACHCVLLATIITLVSVIVCG